MIISGGANIYPAEIEAELIMHPKVADVAVFGIPDEEWGEQVKAVVQPAEGVAPGPNSPPSILASLEGRLAKMKWPKSVDFIDEMPRDPSGKLLKRTPARSVLAGDAAVSSDGPTAPGRGWNRGRDRGRRARRPQPCRTPSPRPGSGCRLTQAQVAWRMNVRQERVSAIERAEPGATEVRTLRPYVQRASAGKAGDHRAHRRRARAAAVAARGRPGGPGSDLGRDPAAPAAGQLAARGGPAVRGKPLPGPFAVADAARARMSSRWSTAGGSGGSP